MLIIAAPKSASTSLLKTLGDIYDLPATQEFRSGDVIPRFATMAKVHSDVRHHPDDRVRGWCESNGFFKQHLPPTTNHRVVTREYPRVLLVRSVSDIMDAYSRAVVAELCQPLGVDSEFLSAEIHSWVGGWLHGFESSDHGIVVWFQDLINNPKKQIGRVSDHFGLDRPVHDVVLRKERYSRDILRCMS